MRDPSLVSADAERILNDPVYAESFQKVKETIVGALESSPMDTDADLARVLNLVRRLQSIVGSKKWLDMQMQYGRLAQTQREHEQQLKKRGFFNRNGL